MDNLEEAIISIMAAAILLLVVLPITLVLIGREAARDLFALWKESS